MLRDEESSSKKNKKLANIWQNYGHDFVASFLF